MSATPPASAPSTQTRPQGPQIPDIPDGRIQSRTRQRVQSIDPAGKNVYQSYLEVANAKKAGTLDANKLQWRDPKTGKLFFLCYK